ncbi:unnamed protein product [Nezara viridula]|uniref:Uncharacterized protein n=1 Tax=Nezara viridula TaxID=85310 RepID=A0A9P0H4N1_NEZVI|nr:unnamed protein product [Nezara viridula]
MLLMFRKSLAVLGINQVGTSIFSKNYVEYFRFYYNLTMFQD